MKFRAVSGYQIIIKYHCVGNGYRYINLTRANDGIALWVFNFVSDQHARLTHRVVIIGNFVRLSLYKNATRTAYSCIRIY
jgi:hypothetical protein